MNPSENKFSSEYLGIQCVAQCMQNLDIFSSKYGELYYKCDSQALLSAGGGEIPLWKKNIFIKMLSPEKLPCYVFLFHLNCFTAVIHLQRIHNHALYIK